MKRTMLKTFYVIMRSINIFSVYYETVAGQIRASDTQIWLARSTFLQSLAPTLIKPTYLWFSNDPEDIEFDQG